MKISGTSSWPRRAESSRRSYAIDFRYFATWCLAKGLTSLPAAPKTLARYLTWLAKRGLAVATIARRAAAVRYVHQIGGHASPTDAILVKATVRGIRRSIGTAPAQKTALTAKMVGKLLDTCDDSLLGRRDRALLALGFAGALRRSELVAVQVADLTDTERGMDLRIRRSKGDQEGKGVVLAIPHGDFLLPVQAIRDWLAASGISEGPVFRPVLKGSRLGNAALTPHAVAVLAKKRAGLAGIDPVLVSAIACEQVTSRAVSSTAWRRCSSPNRPGTRAWTCCWSTADGWTGIGITAGGRSCDSDMTRQALVADRNLLLSHLLTERGRGFEIGALMSPFLPKAGNDVLLVDRMPTDELRAHYAADPNVATDQIAEVDVAIGEGTLEQALRRHAGSTGFDYAIASHVIEHVPDFIGWLGEIAGLLRPGGRLLLVVPDKRYSFDYLRDLSPVSNMIDAWVRKSQKPGPGQVFDYNAHGVELDCFAAWAGTIGDSSTFLRYVGPRAAIDVSRAALNTYKDSHCWVFTPAHFLEVCADLVTWGLLQWRLTAFADTRRDELDFGVVLERTIDDDPADLGAGFRAAIAHTANSKAADPYAEIDRLRSELEAIHASRSWRLTAPLRRLNWLVRGHR